MRASEVREMLQRKRQERFEGWEGLNLSLVVWRWREHEQSVWGPLKPGKGLPLTSARKPGAQSDNRKEQTSANLLRQQGNAISPSAFRQEVFRASKRRPSQVHQTSVPQKLWDKKWEVICSSSDFKQKQALRMPWNIPAPSVEKGIYAKKI